MLHFFVNLDIYSSLFYLATSQSQDIMVIWKDDGSSTVCHSGGYFLSADVTEDVSWPWLSSHGGWDTLCLSLSLSPSLSLYIYSSPFYLAIAQSQTLIGITRESSSTTLCHSCGCAFRKRVLKTLSDPG